MNRRSFVVAVMAAPLLTRRGLAAAPEMTVAKSPTCGCCGAWIDHVRAAGFTVMPRDMSQGDLNDLKARAGISPELSSCHTARIGGYVIEGHVPASDIRRLLADRPRAIGLTVPGMPIGSPGMEMGDTRHPFETLLLLEDGTTEVFARHNL